MMKTTFKLAMALSVLLMSSSLFAQTPEGVNYQATVRNASGDLMVSQDIDVIFNINATTMSGTTIYSESHTLTTNAYGSFSAVVGQGSPTTGMFSAIEWSADEYFLNVNVDGNDLGTSQLMSVPYALHSKTADNVVDPIWKKKQSNGDYYTMGESVIIGDSIASANILTIRQTHVSGEMIDLRADTLNSSSDLINLYAGPESGTNGQFIECNYGNSTSFKVNTDGSVYANKQIETDSSLIVGNEVNRTATGAANLVPIAYGNVSSTGVINSGTGNFSVNTTGTGAYSINIIGESFFYTNYSVSLLISSSIPGFISMNSSGGNMLVYTKDTSGASSNKSFTFIIYKN
jgi:hypothetical protein